jgi:GNAT superfamily N-acetyltransferase
MGSVTTRTVTEAEYAAYRARSVPLYAEELVRARGAEPAAALADSEKTFPATLAEVLAEERTWLLRVLDDQATPVGWLWLGPDPHRPTGVFVYDVEVDEPHRGRGLGRAAMLAVEQIARDAGLTSVGLNVFGWNSRAEALYRSLGYGVDSTQMSKPLTGQP